MRSLPESGSRSGLEIAVIGMACRFPGARDVDEFWRNLRDGVESISFFSEEELRSAGVAEEMLLRPDYVRARGVLDAAECFDAPFFGVNPHEARLMDPQQRVFLECAWAALEDSGYDGERHAGPVGVYAGAYENSYLANLASHPEILESAGWFLTSVNNEKDYVATRVSYKLGLTGPSLTVQTACSTSLVATHLACQGLLSGACDLALAGGVTVRAQQRSGYLYTPEGIFSPDGHCRAFDAAARGTVSSSGAGVVVLKRLEDALEEGDTIHAVILGTAMSNDGGSGAGFTAPSADGQRRAIEAAHAVAGVEPDEISYVETHGSGTALGDPIEVQALVRAFARPGRPPGRCALGSVKTNIGHTHAASGVAGLIKTVLALEHALVPPSLHFEQPNPQIDFEHSPFHVNTELASWHGNGQARRAGVSSFGVGGTNVHAVLEEAPSQPSRPAARPWHLLVLSARTEPALEAMTDNLLASLRQPGPGLADVAYTLQVGRRPFAFRRTLVASSREEAAEALSSRAPGSVQTKELREGDRPVAFLFPGLGQQQAHMGWGLYESERTFREEVDRCAELLAPALGEDIRTVLYPPLQDSASAGSGDGSPQAMDLRALLGRGEGEAVGVPQAVDRTRYAHAAMFVVEHALARLWMSWGVEPQALIGYSIGEYVAACLAGVLTLPDALLLVTGRARLIEGLPGGAMLAVPLPEAEITALLPGGVSLAAVNAPSLCVVAGEEGPVADLQSHLADQGVPCRRLRTSHAFHSAAMKPIAEAYTRLCGSVRLEAPRIPYISNVTGDWITPEEATSPEYWARHMCAPIRFAEGIGKLWESPGRILLETGPGGTLSAVALQMMPPGATDRVALTSMPQSYETATELPELLRAAGRLWLEGVPVEWEALHTDDPRRRVRVPTYPFERQRHWLEPRAAPGTAGTTSAEPLRRRADISSWFAVPAWRSTAPLLAPEPGLVQQEGRRWLVLCDEHGPVRRLAERLRRHGAEVTTVVTGDAFRQIGAHEFAIDHRRRDDYVTLLGRLADSSGLPGQIVHGWTLASPAGKLPLDRGRLEDAQQRGFYSLLYLAQGLGHHSVGTGLTLTVVTGDLHQVTGEEPVDPATATVLGPLTVLPQEQPAITCRSIDVTLPATGEASGDLADRLLAELVRAPADPVVAYRGSRRWTPAWTPLRLEHPSQPPECLRQRGVYLVTGGLGGMGLTLAEYLVRTAAARLVLTGRSALPDREDWEQWLAEHDAHDGTSSRIRAVQALETLGAEVLVAQADVADARQMEAVVRQAEERFGAVNGVIHAAGVPAAGLMQLKDPAVAASVMAPKVQGTLVLDRLFGDADLDFMVLCSSALAVTGGLGQADYCAANAFLDAYARHNAVAGGPFTVAIGWDAWQQLGMASRVTGIGGTRQAAQPQGRGQHPYLARRLLETPARSIHAVEFGAATDWLVDEHRMLGHPVVPGTAFLEMAGAALAQHDPDAALIFEDVLFLSPVVLREAERREVRMLATREGDGIFFRGVSAHRPPGAMGTGWQEHVHGRVMRADSLTRYKHDVARLIEERGLEEVSGPRHRGPMTFGPRSRCLQRLYAGDGEALAVLALLSRDEQQFRLHPSVLDIATGFANLFLEDDFYMPMQYSRIEVAGRLEGLLYSHLRYTSRAPRRRRETLTFDVTIMDHEGSELVRVRDFTMKRARALPDKLVTYRDGTSSEIAVFDGPVEPATVPAGDGVFDENVQQGILPTEGVEAFERILAARVAPHVTVTTRDLGALIEHERTARSRALASPPEPERRAEAHPRPNLVVSYVAPRTEVERRLAGVWEELLGVSQVGLHDDFFALGGHSLLGLQLLARLRQEFGVELTLKALFGALTVAELAAVLSPGHHAGG